MFTGIVEHVGTVAAIETQGEIVRLVIEAGPVSLGVRIGDSISVSGGCLTVTVAEGEQLHFEAISETMERTALGALRPGSKVNLERALRADARLDGHIVQGHVDGMGRVRDMVREGDDVRLYVDCDEELAEVLVEKGSVAIDGVSLTVVGVGETGFDVALIPHTLQATTLGERRTGDPVNLEADVIGKYVKRYLERMLPDTDDRATP